MKLRFLTIIAVLIVSVSVLDAQVDFGVIGGVNFQNITGKNASGDKVDNGLLVGFHAGLNASIPIAPDFYFQPGLLYSMKGARSNFFVLPDKSASNDYNTVTRISYIEMPLNLLFRPQFADGHILLGFGPYVAFGIGGKQKFDADPIFYEQKIRFKNKITSSEAWDVDYAYYRPFDAGANIFAGYEFNTGLFFRLNAQLGLLRINPDIEGSDNAASFKNTGFGLSAGFNF
jgi:hypothetical protein